MDSAPHDNKCSGYSAGSTFACETAGLNADKLTKSMLPTGYFDALRIVRGEALPIPPLATLVHFLESVCTTTSLARFAHIITPAEHWNLIRVAAASTLIAPLPHGECLLTAHNAPGPHGLALHIDVESPSNLDATADSERVIELGGHGLFATLHIHASEQLLNACHAALPFITSYITTISSMTRLWIKSELASLTTKSVRDGLMALRSLLHPDDSPFVWTYAVNGTTGISLTDEVARETLEQRANGLRNDLLVSPLKALYSVAAVQMSRENSFSTNAITEESGTSVINITTTSYSRSIQIAEEYFYGTDRITTIVLCRTGDRSVGIVAAFPKTTPEHSRFNPARASNDIALNIALIRNAIAPILGELDHLLNRVALIYSSRSTRVERTPSPIVKYIRASIEPPLRSI